jgi:hypothetical protein
VSSRKLLGAVAVAVAVVSSSACTTRTIVSQAAGADAGSADGAVTEAPVDGAEPPATAPDDPSPSSCTQCAKGCFDLQRDPKNCGSCGKTCATTASGTAGVCVAGKCYEKCPRAGDTVCNGTCVDLQSDGENCGICGQSCGSPIVCSIPVCKAGACADSFKPDWSDCVGNTGQTDYEACTAGGACARTLRCKTLGAVGYDLIYQGVIQTTLKSCSCQGTKLVGTYQAGGAYTQECTSCRAVADGYACH